MSSTRGSAGALVREILNLCRPCAGEQNRAVERVPERLTKARPDARGEPVAKVRRYAAHQAAVRSTAFEHRADHRSDPLRRFLHDQLAGGVALVGVLHDHRRKGCIVARSRARGPVDDLACRSMEMIEQLARKRRVRNASVSRPQRAADRAQTELGAAAFVGHRKSIPADREDLIADAGEADASGSDDDDRTILPGMRAEIGNRSIACEGCRPERKGMRLETVENSAPVEAGDADARVNRRDLAQSNAGLIDRVPVGFLDHVECMRKTGRRVGGPGFAGAENVAAFRNQPCARVGAAGVYPEVQRHHLLG